MELQVGVKVLLKNPDGKYLLIRRSAYEETGLTMTSEPKIVGAQDIFIPEQSRHVVRITYFGTAEGEPKLSDEHTEHSWVTFDELKSISAEELDRYLKALLEAGSIPSPNHG